MPVVYSGFIGVKLVSVYPRNAERGLPTHLATIHLFNEETGESLAVLDGRLITEMRTAAVSAIATRMLASGESRVLAILGSGVQARAHLEALRLVRDFKEVRVWSRTKLHAVQFAEQTDAFAVATAEAAVRSADVIVTATNSAEPILHGEWLKEGVHINAVGAVGATRRELDASAMQAAVVVESREAALRESGDILLSGVSIYAELGELLNGTIAIPHGTRTIYKSLGVAIEDIAAASLVYSAIA